MVGGAGQPCSLPCTPPAKGPGKGGACAEGPAGSRDGKPHPMQSNRALGQERSRKPCPSSAASTWRDCGQSPVRKMPCLAPPPTLGGAYGGRTVSGLRQRGIQIRGPLLFASLTLGPALTASLRTSVHHDCKPAESLLGGQTN